MSYSLSGRSVGERGLLAEQIRQFAARYTTLLGALASAGTQVEVDRTLEVDPDIDPHTFFRDARHVFVFPPQEVQLSDKEGAETGELPWSSPYTLTREAQIAVYDPTRVEGRVTVTYDDAGYIPCLLASTALGDGLESKLPGAVITALEEAFGPIAL